MDLVSHVRSQLNPAVVSGISRALGLPHGPVARGIEAAVPAVLASLAGTVASRQGAARLGRVMRAVDPALSRTYPALVTRSARFPVLETGNDALRAMLGAGGTRALSSALGRYTGLATVEARAVMAAVTPLILAQLCRHPSAGRLSADSVAALLASQQQPIAQSIPRKFSGMIRAVPATVRLSGHMPEAGQRIGEASTRDSVAPTHLHRPPLPGSPSIDWRAPDGHAAIMPSARPAPSKAAPGHVLLRAILATLLALGVGASIVWRYLMTTP